MIRRWSTTLQALALGVISIYFLANPIRAEAGNLDETNTLIPIEIDNQAHEDLRSLLYDQVQVIPVPLQQMFIADDWEISLETADVGRDYNYTVPISGITDYGNERIRVIATIHADKHDTVLHAFGHYFDGIYHTQNKEYYSYSQTPQWHEIYIAEKDKIPNSIEGKYNATGVAYNETEYFAEVFRTYIRNNSGLANNCPLSYGYVGTLINNYC